MSWEKRKHPRFECRGTASVQIAAGKPPCPAKIVDLSAEGCLLILREQQNLMKDITVELAFEINHLPFRVRAQAKAVRSEKMVGFQFLDLNERARRNLKDLVEEVKADMLKHLIEIREREDWLKAHRPIDSEDSSGWSPTPPGDETQWSDGTGQHPKKP
jgi:hypothetical protein